PSRSRDLPRLPSRMLHRSPKAYLAVALTATSLPIPVWLANGRWQVGYWAQNGLGVQLESGRVLLTSLGVTDKNFLQPGAYYYECDPYHLDLWPLLKRSNGSSQVAIPIWTLSPVLCTAAIYFFRHRRSRTEAWSCPKCSYDRSGLVDSLPCPECGWR